MSVQILGLGTAVPEFEIEQRDAAQQASQLSGATAQQERAVGTLYRRAGVKKRHSVVLESSTNGAPARQRFYTSDGPPLGPTTAERMQVYDTHAAPLAIEAADAALRDANVRAAEITHVVSVSCSGFSAPGIDVALVRELGLGAATARTHIGFMGCQGALNGMRVAKAFAESDRNACVLLCAVELCSLHHQYTWQPDQLVANALFADGAAALVLRAGADSHAPWQIADVRSTVIADSADMMSWRIKDHGFQMTLSPQVPELIDRNLRPWLDSWLREHNLTVDQIGSWAVHPGGPRIVDACARAISAGADCLADSYAVLSEYGNMSSPTVLFILDRLRRRSAPRPCLALAFGPGISIEAALLR